MSCTWLTCTCTAPLHLPKKVTQKPSVNHIGSSDEPPIITSRIASSWYLKSLYFIYDKQFSKCSLNIFLRHVKQKLRTAKQTLYWGISHSQFSGNILQTKNQWTKIKSTSLLHKTVRSLDINRSHVVSLFTSMSTNVVQFLVLCWSFQEFEIFLETKCSCFRRHRQPHCWPLSYSIKAAASQRAEAQFLKNYPTETSKLCDYIPVLR